MKLFRLLLELKHRDKLATSLCPALHEHGSVAKAHWHVVYRQRHLCSIAPRKESAQSWLVNQTEFLVVPTSPDCMTRHFKLLISPLKGGENPEALYRVLVEIERKRDK